MSGDPWQAPESAPMPSEHKRLERPAMLAVVFGILSFCLNPCMLTSVSAIGLGVYVLGQLQPDAQTEPVRRLRLQSWAGIVLGGLSILLAALLVVVVFGLAALGASLEENFEEVSKDLVEEYAPA